MMKLEFEATITDAKPVMAKQASYGDSGSGELRLTLTLKQPAAPRKPRAPWVLDRACPEPLKRKAKESDEEYAARSEQRNREIADWKSAQRRYETELVAFETESATYQARLMSYASLVGLAAVFGSKPLMVTLVPVEQGLLPDYGVSLLRAAPVDVTPSPETAVPAIDLRDAGDDPNAEAFSTDPCPECEHARALHDDTTPPGCAGPSDEDGNLCECELGATGW